VSLERGPLSLVSTIDELLGRNGSGSGLEIREYGHRNPSSWPRGSFYSQKLALTFTDKRRSLGRYSSLANSGHRIFSCIEPQNRLYCTILNLFIFISRFLSSHSLFNLRRFKQLLNRPLTWWAEWIVLDMGFSQQWQWRVVSHLASYNFSDVSDYLLGLLLKLWWCR
jgi:hypothetical protein